MNGIHTEEGRNEWQNVNRKHVLRDTKGKPARLGRNLEIAEPSFV
jgi:hypothetical protein